MDTRSVSTFYEQDVAPHAKQSLRLWLRLLATTTLVEKGIRAHLKTHCGSTLPRFDVLAAMERSASRMTMSQLSDRLLVSNGNVTGVVNRLVEDGLVQREVDHSDRRTQFVSLTPVGRRSFKKMAQQHEDLVEEIFSDVPDVEIAELLGLMTTLSHLVQQKIDPLLGSPPESQ